MRVERSIGQVAATAFFPSPRLGRRWVARPGRLYFAASGAKILEPGPQDVELLERRLHVRQAIVRNELTTPKSRAGRRVVPLGDVATAALEEQFSTSLHRVPESIVFSHPALGTPLDPSKLTTYARKALALAGVGQGFRPWHGLRHTALTETAAAGVPALFVQAKAGHAQGSTTERYLHGARTSYPDAAELAEARLFPTSAASGTRSS